MSKGASSARPATYQDLLRAPADQLAEILDGELVLTPRPSLGHAGAATALGADVFGSFHRRPGGPGGPGGWWILFEPELHLGSDVLVPDVAGWRRERVPTIPSGPFTTLVPDFICEVLSPSTAGRDRVAKMRIWARESVRHVWLVDPEARTVEVFRLQSGQWLRAQSVAGSAPARLEPFDAAEFDLSRWWGETPDPPDLGP